MHDSLISSEIRMQINWGVLINEIDYLRPIYLSIYIYINWTLPTSSHVNQKNPTVN